MNLKITKENLFILGVFFIIIIPKGGIKVSSIPLTWGYIYLGILFFFLSIFYINSKNTLISLKHYLSYLATLPFIIYFTINLLFRGYSGTFGNFIAFYVSLGFMPLFFLVLTPFFLNKIDRDLIERVISKSIFIVSVFGIFLFIYKQVTGSYLEIPYITLNAGDIGELGKSKFNARGSVFKLISTYNNGNIFGVCILILFPVFHERNTSIWKLFIVCLALLLTLSRTVWIGMAFFFIIQYRKKILSLLKIYLTAFFIFIFLSFIVFTRSFQYGSLNKFILDPNLGGRFSKIVKIDEITLFGMKQYEVIEEIIYLSVFEQLGIVGLIFFCFSFIYPIYLYGKTNNNRYVHVFGCIIYLFVAISDGCILLIPTMALYYFSLSMAFCSNNEPKKSISKNVYVKIPN